MITLDELRKLQDAYYLRSRGTQIAPDVKDWIKNALEDLGKQATLRDGGRQASKWLVKAMSLYDQLPTMHPVKAVFCAGVLEYFITLSLIHI